MGGAGETLRAPYPYEYMRLANHLGVGRPDPLVETLRTTAEASAAATFGFVATFEASSLFWEGCLKFDSGGGHTLQERPGPATGAPSLSLPKGGGAIRGIGEKFTASPVTGTGSISIQIPTSPGRSGFGPQLQLSYDSGAGNGTFGLGWSLSAPAITRKTDKGLPQYRDAEGSDVFVLSGAEDLVPMLGRGVDGAWRAEPSPLRDIGGANYRVDRYRPRIEGLFARVERWSNVGDASDVFWRSISKDNVTTWYGRTAQSRIADPADPRRIFSWLISQSCDDRGNVIVYGYKAEDSGGIQAVAAGAKAHERNRTDASRSAQRYLKRVRYGNKTPYLPRWMAHSAWPAPLGEHASDGAPAWHFELVLDYGEHDEASPTPNDAGVWPVRPDPFSSFRAGFEVRTYRSCRRFLMFHHFLEEAEIGRDCLVSSTDLRYADPTEGGPLYSKLCAVTQTGYRRSAAGYLRAGLPPVELEYSEPVVQDVVEQIDPASLENLPIGLDGQHYRWVDLHGEGIPGILSEQGGAWLYKRNLSPLTADRGEDPKARFAALEQVALKPNAALGAGAELLDLAGDGQPDLVVMDDPIAGLYEHDDAEGWQPFRAFIARLNRDLRDPNLRFIDLDGDGRADVLITEQDAFVCHASLAEAGFGPARRVAQALDEEQGPRVVFADAAQSIHLADLSGDGLADIVRIRNGEVCYWPNLGHGRFGRKVSMDNAPWFDHPEQFDHRRIRLADIDGSGTTDIVYLHGGGVRLYFNQSGNSWSAPRQLPVFPRIDDLTGIVPVDLLGNGTCCLVWSSASPGDARRPMQYVNLMGGRKPHLLVGVLNNLGAETHIDYAPSTRFYLQDQRDGKPWVTRLPFPVQVVERVETIDRINRSRFVTRYAYHHGHFDGEEREFRGFGMVEQWDTEAFAAFGGSNGTFDNLNAASHVPAVYTRRWYHTGVWLGGQRIADPFARPEGARASEYFREPGRNDAEAAAMRLPDTELPLGLALDEQRQACRALKGSLLREEVYADDAGEAASAEQLARARTPYRVSEWSFGIRVLQPCGPNRHAVFLAHPCEMLSCHYERNAADPRIRHRLTLEVDDHGNVLKQAEIGYGRRAHIRVVDAQGQAQWVANPGLEALGEDDRAKQATTLLTYSESRFTHAIDFDDAHRSPQPCETQTFELSGYAASGPAMRYRASDLVEPDTADADTDTTRLRHLFDAPEVPYEATATGNRRRRCIRRQRILYRRDDLSGLLPLGELEPMALAGEGYQLAFTSGLLAQVFQRRQAAGPAESLLPDVANVLGGQGGSRGGYLQGLTLRVDGRFPGDGEGDDDAWWLPSGRGFFSTDPAHDAAAELAQARQHFFLTRRHRDAFGHDTAIDFDAYDLLIARTRDAVGNEVRAEANDYRVLQPQRISDANRNLTEVAFDALGMVVGTAVIGKPAQAEGDSLEGFAADLAPAQLEAFFDGDDPRAAAAALLQSGSQRIVYDLYRYRRTRQAHPGDPARWQPACTATLARETHAGAPLPPHGLRIRLDFAYSDGFGRVVQQRSQAAAGPIGEGGPLVTLRWVASGWTVFNNKGKPVRRFEPFFSDSHRYEFGVKVGVSPVLFYDPAERVVATLHPNHSFEKVVFDPWQQTTWDVNDTCAPRNDQTGDPRSDRDIAGYVAGYFKAMGVAAASWQTWHGQRIGGGLGVHERNAALRAQAHADTPTTVHFDALGRAVMTVARNRVVCAGHDLDGSEQSIATRVDLDIAGQARAVRDEHQRVVDDLPTGALEQRIVMQRDFDLLGRCLRQSSMEAGARWNLDDAAGQAIRSWDDRGHCFTNEHDALRRGVARTVRGTRAAGDDASDLRTLGRELLIDKVEYGENAADAEALNLCTRVHRHFDTAGVTTNGYDFKGNLQRSTRSLLRDYRALPDWSQPAQPQLESESFEASTRYDALNRPVQSLPPRRRRTAAGAAERVNVMQPVYNEAGLWQRVDVWLERAAEPDALLDPALQPASPVGVAAIDYDAKGQRLRIDYKNGASSAYRYDPLTFRLRQLLTRRSQADFADDDPTPPQGPWPGRHLQNLSFSHDPAGNITRIEDEAQQATHFRNRRVEPSSDYAYDALYRLIEARGREHLGQGQAGGAAPSPSSALDALQSRLAHPGDGNAMGTYVERYVHDAAGNLLQLQHRGSDPAHVGWTRAFHHLEDSRIEDGTTSNRLSHAELNGNGALERYRHDAHGNMLRMPHLGGGADEQNLHWDCQDRLHRADLGGGGTACYVYDAAGRRVRKVWEKAPGLVEERIYFAGSEIFRRHQGPIGDDSAVLERQTLHIGDDWQRIALVETRTLDTAGADPSARQLIRYQLGNHLGSAVLELDAQARIISYEEYSPYGSTTYQAVRDRTESAKRYRYTGKERDEESGLYYHGARYYAPWLARWTACDPLGIAATLNGLAYARGNPLRNVDPTGMADEPVQPVDRYGWLRGRSFISPDNTREVGKRGHKEINPVIAERSNRAGRFTAAHEVGTLPGGSKTPGSSRRGSMDVLLRDGGKNYVVELKPWESKKDAFAEASHYSNFVDSNLPSEANRRPMTDIADDMLDPVHEKAGIRSYLLTEKGTQGQPRYYAFDKIITKYPPVEKVRSVMATGATALKTFGTAAVPGAAEGMAAAETIGLTATRFGMQRVASAALAGARAPGPAIVGGIVGAPMGYLAEGAARSYGLDEAASVGTGTAAAGLTGATVTAGAAAFLLLVASAPVTITALAGAAIVGGLAASFGYLSSRAMQ